MLTKKAIIMAAGKGTRMKSELPKVLFPVLGRPMIEYVIDALDEAGVTEKIVVIGYRGDLVRQQLEHHKDIRFVEQTEQLGTGHAVMVCKEELADFQGPVFVIAGDSPMLQADSVKKLFDAFFDQSTASNVSCILGTAHKDHPFGMGRILRDDQGRFLGIVEERDANDDQKNITEINMSYYIFDTQDLLASLGELKTNNSQKEYYITDVPSILMNKNKEVLALPVLQPIESLGVNTIADLAVVEDAMKKRNV